MKPFLLSMLLSFFFAILATFLGTKLCNADEVQEYITHLRDLNQAFYGKTAVIQSESTNGISWTHHVTFGATGVVANFTEMTRESRGLNFHQTMVQVLLKNGFLGVGKSWKDGDDSSRRNKVVHSGTLFDTEYTEDELTGRVLAGASPIFAVDAVSGLTWADILSRSKTSAKISRSDDLVSVECDSRTLGKHLFKFSVNSDKPSLVEVASIREGAQIPTTLDCQSQVRTISGISLMDKDGACWIRTIDSISISSKFPDPSRNTNTEINANCVTVGDSPDSTSLQKSLTDYGIEDGTEVKVRNGGGLSYILQDGQLTRSVSESIIVSKEAAKFRANESASGNVFFWLTLVGVAVTGVCLVLWIRRHIQTT